MAQNKSNPGSKKNPAGGYRPPNQNQTGQARKPAGQTNPVSTSPKVTPTAPPSTPTGAGQARRLTPKQEAMRRRQQRRRRIQIIIAGMVTVVVVVAAIIIALILTRPTNLIDIPGTPTQDTAAFTIGSADAKVTLIAYGDFRCPACKSYFDSTETTIKDRYVKTGKIKYVFRNLTIIDENMRDTASTKAAQGGYCAADQKRFWDFHDVMYSNFQGEIRDNISDKFLKDIGKSLNLDTNQFNSCIDSYKDRQKIADEKKAARDKGINSTPTFLVQVGTGAEEKVDVTSASDFVTPITTKLDEALKKAEEAK